MPPGASNLARLIESPGFVRELSRIWNSYGFQGQTVRQFCHLERNPADQEIFLCEWSSKPGPSGKLMIVHFFSDSLPVYYFSGHIEFEDQSYHAQFNVSDWDVFLKLLQAAF